MDNICKSCYYWMNKQRELEYLEEWGICEGELMTDWDKPKKIKILCDDARSYIPDSHIDSDGSLTTHKFRFCTHYDFGCKLWKK